VLVDSEDGNSIKRVSPDDLGDRLVDAASPVVIGQGTDATKHWEVRDFLDGAIETAKGGMFLFQNFLAITAAGRNVAMTVGRLNATTSYAITNYDPTGCFGIVGAKQGVATPPDTQWRRAAAGVWLACDNTGALGTVRAATIDATWPLYTIATVPTASSYTGYRIAISDRSYRAAYSDGTDWRFESDDAVIS
jgi:hypothetical protein